MTLDRKIRYGSTVTALTGLASWLLVSFAFHGALPPDVAYALPMVISALVGWVTAYYTKHAPRDLRQGISKLTADATIIASQVQTIRKLTAPASLPFPPTLATAAQQARTEFYSDMHPDADLTQMHVRVPDTSPPAEAVIDLTTTNVTTPKVQAEPAPVGPGSIEGVPITTVVPVPAKVNEQQALGLDPYGVEKK